MIFQAFLFYIHSTVALVSFQTICREQSLPGLRARTRSLRTSAPRNVDRNHLIHASKEPFIFTDADQPKDILDIRRDAVGVQESRPEKDLWGQVDRKFRVRRGTGARSWCGHCHRPKRICLCAALPKDRPLDTRTRVALFVHPEELQRAFGTAIILRLCLKHIIIKVGDRFPEPEEDPELHAALTEGGHRCLVMFPGKDAEELRCSLEDEECAFSDVLSKRPPTTLILIDGRWGKAKAMFLRSPWLQQLPCAVIRPTSHSGYFFRKQPKAGYLSTLEAASEALLALEGGRGPALKEALLAPFHRMVQHQKDFIPQETDKNV